MEKRNYSRAAGLWVIGLAEMDTTPPNNPKVTRFDKEVKRLRLKPAQFETSVALKRWVRKNRSRRFVPEYLLNHWKLDVHLREWEDAATIAYCFSRRDARGNVNGNNRCGGHGPAY